MKMQNQSASEEQLSKRNSNVRFTFGPTHLDENPQYNSDPKQNFGKIITEANQKQAQMMPNINKTFSQEFSHVITVHLIELESKWIQKETQIKEYVENLKKTIEEKDLKIEKLHIENYKLSSQLTQIGKQKDDIFEKLNQIHGTMISLHKQKNHHDSDRKSHEKFHRSQQNEMIAEILKLTKQKDSKQFHSLPPQSRSSERSSERENSQTQAKYMEKRILCNLIKLFEENFNICPSLRSDQSSQHNGEYPFARKERQVRATMATNDTYGSNPRGSLANKCANSPIGSQKLNPSNEIKKKPNCYKSARTITFSKDEEIDEQNQIDRQKFYSHNVIQFNPKIYSEGDTSERKESQRSSLKKQQELLLKNKINQKESQSNPLKIQSRALNQSYQSSQFMKEKKRNKERKKTTNLDYSLSSSLVSESQTNEMDYKVQDQEQKQSFKPLTHQTIEEKKNEIHLSKLSASEFNNKRSEISENSQAFMPMIEKRSIENLQASNQFSEEDSQNRLPFEQAKISSKLNQSQTISKKSDENKKLSNPEFSPPLKKSSLIINNAFTFQNSPQNRSNVLQNTTEKLNDTSSKKALTIQKQNSITFDQTNQKKPSFQPNQIDSFETEVKDHQNQHFKSNLSIPNDKRNLFVTKIGPQTKCSSFQEKSYGNSFYFSKSNSSDDPFKRLKIQQENYENQQHNKGSKLNFENQMLKSYNKVLEKQTKKMSQTQKLMEKFNTQNVSILNKIHKKSIS